MANNSNMNNINDNTEKCWQWDAVRNAHNHHHDKAHDHHTASWIVVVVVGNVIIVIGWC
jgi:hypothetical protein